MLGPFRLFKMEIQYIRDPRSDWDTVLLASRKIFIYCKAIISEEFTDLDVEKQGNEIFKRLYGTDGLYVDMCKNVGMYMWKPTGAIQGAVHLSKLAPQMQGAWKAS